MIKSNFTLILSEVNDGLKVYESSSDDPGFQKYIANRFLHHMESGTHNEPLTDIDDIGDRILIGYFNWAFNVIICVLKLSRISLHISKLAIANISTISTVSLPPVAVSKTPSAAKSAQQTAAKPTVNVVDLTTVLSKS